MILPIVLPLLGQTFAQSLHELLKLGIINLPTCQLVMVNVSKGDDRLATSEQLKQVLDRLVVLQLVLVEHLQRKAQEQWLESGEVYQLVLLVTELR